MSRRLSTESLSWLVSDICCSSAKIELLSGICCLAISSSFNRLLTRIVVMLFGSIKSASGAIFEVWKGCWPPWHILLLLPNKVPVSYCSWCHTRCTWYRWLQSIGTPVKGHMMDQVFQRSWSTLWNEPAEQPLFQDLDLFVTRPFLGQHNIPYWRDELWLNLEERTMVQLWVPLFKSRVIKSRRWVSGRFFLYLRNVISNNILDCTDPL